MVSHSAPESSHPVRGWRPVITYLFGHGARQSDSALTVRRHTRHMRPVFEWGDVVAVIGAIMVVLALVLSFLPR